MPYRLSMKFTLLLGLLLAFLLGVGLYLIDQRGQYLIRQDEIARVTATAETTISGLKGIMLDGRGDTTQAWLRRVAAQPSIDFARIYRLNGVEAFNDLETVQAVNRFLSEPRFSRHSSTGSGRINPSLKAVFDQVVKQNRQTVVGNHGQMTILSPVRAEPACQACHGYTQNMLRGVLVMEVSTVAATSRMERLLSQITLGFLLIILLFVAVAAACLRTLIIKPLMTLNTAAKTISGGDLGYRIRSERKDEIGTVAQAFDHLVEHLEDRIEGESKQKKRQQLLTDAVISLSRQTVKKDILHHVGELAMEMVKARYAMVIYTDAKGQRHLVPLGISEQQIAAVARLPKGEGLLKLFLNNPRAIRVSNIISHPDSVGFPEGHPSMRSLLGVPIIFGGNILGAIYLTDRSDHCDFSEEDEHVITLLASACAIALSNLRNAQSELAVVNQRLQTREIELELINEELTQANERSEEHTSELQSH